MSQNIKFGPCKQGHSIGSITQDHKSKTENTNDKSTKYKLAQPPLIPIEIYKRVLHNLQYHDSCNVYQGSFIHATSHAHKQKQGCEQDLSPPITLTRP